MTRKKARNTRGPVIPVVIDEVNLIFRLLEERRETNRLLVELVDGMRELQKLVALTVPNWGKRRPVGR